MLHSEDAASKEERLFSFRRWHLIAFALCFFDILCANISYALALLIRFDFRFLLIPPEYWSAFRTMSFGFTLFMLIIFALFRMYHIMWQFASVDEFLRILLAWFVVWAGQIAGTILFVHRMPISYYLIGGLLHLISTVLVRFAYRIFIWWRAHRMHRSRYGDPIVKKRTMVIGAGEAGQVVLRELKRSDFVQATPVCVIDDNENKWKRYIEGVPIVGGREDILAAVEKYQINQILLAMPSASAKDRREILNICKETPCELKSLPGIYQFVEGDVLLSRMKPVALEDLLGRDPIHVDTAQIREQIRGKTVLVTGGGGTIGSELCRQVASHSPKKLVIFDIYENNAYAIGLELKEKYPDLDYDVLIGSVRDRARVDEVFALYRPDIVYHAAAHKHVPLMEDSPNEAIKNNVLGTYRVALAALRFGTARFVLISTDKAVNPTNVMGASKRMCEMVVQSMDQMALSGDLSDLPDLSFLEVDDALKEEDWRFLFGEKGKECEQWHMQHAPIQPAFSRYSSERAFHTEYVAVRFGNVLGSNGSVIPIFKHQIEQGGPVTVTHPDIIRFFMTIPEAVSLVMQAGVYAHGGEIFVLNMGEPVKIDTLARNLIKLSGFKPDDDIRIVYTGLRPGEKLYEETLMKEEGMQTTPNEMIFIGRPIAFDRAAFFQQMRILCKLSYQNDPRIRDAVESVVPTYQKPASDGNF